MNPTTRSTRITELDGLRGLAILLVVFYHYVYGGIRPEDGSVMARFIRVFFPLSWSGVDLFFVLSGFLIGGNLINFRNTGNYFKTFYIRRICRIVPAYFAWLGLFFVVVWLLSSFVGKSWYEITFVREIPNFPKWGYALFLQNFYIAKTESFGSSWLSATWSLAAEEQFYLLLPLFIWIVSPKNLLGTLVFCILLIPTLRIFLYLYHPSIFMHVLLPCRADTFLIGVLCACLVRQAETRYWLEKNRERIYLTFAILLLGMTILTIFANAPRFAGLFTLYNSFEMISFGYSWIAMFYASLLIIVVTGPDEIMAGALRSPFLRYFGTIAYGVFLFHMAVNDLAHGLILGKAPTLAHFSDVAVTSLAFLLTLLLAAFSWNFLEKPIVNWGHSFSYNRRIFHPNA